MYFYTVGQEFLSKLNKVVPLLYLYNYYWINCTFYEFVEGATLEITVFSVSIPVISDSLPKLHCNNNINNNNYNRKCQPNFSNYVRD